MPTHPTGVWLTEGGDVVYEQPEGRSTQVVAKGGSVSSAAKALLETHGVTVDEPDAEPEGDKPEAVTTDDVTPQPAKRAAKKSSK